MTKLKICLLISVFVVLLWGCNGSDERSDVCEGIIYDESGAPDPIQTVVSTFIGSNAPTCYDFEYMESEDSNVNFVVVEYGEQNDCPAGCFSSVVCAIVDIEATGGSYLYSAKWYHLQEIPSGLDESCSGLEQGDTIDDCAIQPPGFDHSITQTTEFNETLMESGRLFRFCD